MCEGTAMNLDVGCGGGIFRTDAQSEICCDIDIPQTRLDYFVRCDADHLPFRNNEFEVVFAYNLLEHMKHPYETVRELRRVGKVVRIRQDKILCLASYATPEHYQFQLPGLIFVPYPRTRLGIEFSKSLRRLLISNSTKSIIFRSLLKPIISRHYYVEL
jgi:SAM-dependent methyltransferase